MDNNLAIYIHWPFCVAKCPYCDFNSHVRDHVAYDEWQAAYLHELSYFKEIIAKSSICSIFFGGGTPSLMPPALVDNILAYISGLGKVSANVEITLEANPNSVEAAKFSDFRNAGINRVSIGVQALNDQDLKFLGRAHSKTEALKAIDLAKKYFPRFSFDLIYARPGQTLSMWESELVEALSLADKHISLYQLTIEKGTKFYSLYNKGNFALPDEDLAAEMYELTQAITESHGLPAYEISNHARPGEECKHNLVYWQYGNYLGIGPGAHSRVNGKALTMIYHPENWLNIVREKGAGIQHENILKPQEMLQERVLMGLRLMSGLDLTALAESFNTDAEFLLNQQAIQQFREQNLLVREGNYLKATSQGRLLLNRIIEQLV